MSENAITGNGSTRWLLVNDSNAHLAIHGTFDGVSIAVEQDVNGTTYDLLDEGVAIVITVATDERLNLSVGDKIRLTATGAGASTAIDYKIANAREER